MNTSAHRVYVLRRPGFRAAWLMLATLSLVCVARGQDGVYDSASAWRGGSNPNIKNNQSQTLQPGMDSFTYNDGVIFHSSIVLQGYNRVDISLATPPYVYPNGIFASSSAATAWTDQLTISNPLYTGQQGTFTASALFDLHGAYDPWVQGPTLIADFYVGGNVATGVYANDQGPFPIDISSLTLTATTTFTYGTPFAIGADLTAGGITTNYSIYGSEQFEVMASVQWLGFSVTAPDSSPDMAFSSSSSSATDYTVPAAVPEPATEGEWMAGLAALAGLAVKRKKSGGKKANQREAARLG